MLWLTLVVFSLVRGEGEYEDLEEKPIEREAEFTSISAKVLVNEGQTIRLPCFVDRIEGYVLLWKFGETILSVGGRVIDSSRERRLLLEEETNGNFLVINKAVSSDGGDYMCQISAYRPKDIKHSVIVRTRPRVQVIGDEVVTVSQGEKLTLKCNIVGGHPVPEVSWRKEGGGEAVFGHDLQFGNLTREDSGKYVCRGDNGFSSDHTDAVQVVVQHPPYVEQNDQYIHSSQDGPVSINCHVVSHPPATVQWYQGGQDTPLSSLQYNITHNSTTNIHTLLVTPPQTENTTAIETQYSCEATNSLGSDTNVVIVSSRPGMPVVTNDLEDTRLLHWTVNSGLPVTTFLLEVRGPDISREVKVSRVDESGNSTWSGQYSALGLGGDNLYRARVRGVSEHGEGPHSDWVEFGIVINASSCDNLGALTLLLIMCAFAASLFPLLLST